MVSVPGAGGVAAASVATSTRSSPAVGNGPTSISSTKPKPKVNSNGYHPPNPNTALSAMTSAPLDLTSVERRGQATAVREPLRKKTRPHGIDEAPTFCPTEEEWQDPGEYVKKISPEASQYGICKIIPPESWNPEFAIDTENFHFRTRKQELNSVEGNSRANLTYLDGLAKFHKQQGSNLHRLPYVDKKPLDLYRLKKAVESRGGFEKVCKHKKWAEIGRDLGYSGKIMSSLSTSLKNSYQKWLCPYEDYLRLAKPGVHQQLENEYGGPLTPSPAPSPVKRSNVTTPPKNGISSPARHASDVLHTSVNGLKIENDTDTLMSDVPAPPTRPGSAFTAVNSGGFTPMNNVAGAASQSPGFTPDPRRPDSPMSSFKNTPETRPASLFATASMKRQASVESSSEAARRDSDVERDDGDGSNRRSKRLKKDAVPTVAGSHMSVFRPCAPKVPKDDDGSLVGERCETCGKGQDAGDLLLCDSCDHSYHGPCHDPPLKRKPDAEWNCARCLVGDGHFGFEEGGLYSLKQFQQKANDFKQGYFEKKMPYDHALECHRPVTEEDVEAEFWRLVADLEETVEVEYGADIHCTTHGSGFPTVEKDPSNPYATDPWNLTVLPFHNDSLFRHIKTDISGMTVPWVYVGMIFSTFCWHNEDHYAYSANYQHFGATKTWYGIPGDDADKFEAAMREAVPELFETQPDLLFQLVTLLTPEQLRKAGVRVYAIDQRAGQMVITFPQAYHAGFNHGFNFNEAVNFAPPDWEPYGLTGVERLQSFRRQPCFSHDELLWTAAEGSTASGLTIPTAKWLAPALRRIQNREMAQRQDFYGRHVAASPHSCKWLGGQDECPLTFKVSNEDVADEDDQCCAYCKSFSYLSRYRCLQSGKVLCVTHAGSHPCCEMTESERLLGHKHEFTIRKTESDMDETYGKVYEKGQTPEAWEERYEQMLDEETTPSLKGLRNLLHEGDRIPYTLPSLPALREFVDRCNDWVEEATGYIVRKQQNRRKNDKAWQSGARKSIGNSEAKEKDHRDVSNMDRLLDDADRIGFECPEIALLQERSDAVKKFRRDAIVALENASKVPTKDIEDLLEEGRSFNVDIPEAEQLTKVLAQLHWNERAEASRKVFLSLREVKELIDDATELGIQSWNDHLVFYTEQWTYGQKWEEKATELISQDMVPMRQLQDLAEEVYNLGLPVSKELFATVDQILNKQREATRQIRELLERSGHPEYQKRPKYAEVVDVIKKNEDAQAKPVGLLDLDNDKKRHEDWMRKGKKLFGKSNAPLHILKSHLEYVLERNSDCFDVEHDTVRMPGEPVSREASPDGTTARWDEPKSRQVFCICRRVEAGMMIECELCHEWYHYKCLKIARGKVKDDDKYTCPICDWRMKIPRDAARPKLEDLTALAEEMQQLPFQPDEEDVLNRIINNAQNFRDRITQYCNPILATEAETETQRFYLRKLEGAEVLLTYETNLFRQELHKFCPVAPNPPPILDVSLSTRKPRPTKLQKMLVEYGVENPDDLPDHVKGKANSLRRKAANAEAAAAAATSRGPGDQHAETSDFGLPAAYDTSQQGSIETPHGPSDQHMTSPMGNEMGPDFMDIDPSMSQNVGAGGPHLMVNQPSHLSLEERILQDLTDGIDLNTEAGKSKALEILGRTETGRREAMKIFGNDIWGASLGSRSDHGRSLTPSQMDDLMKDDDGNVDQMFKDMTNHDDEEQKKKDA